MKATVRKLKDIRGRIRGYAAAFGPCEGEGSTPAEATAQCEETTLAALARLDRGARVARWHGHIYAVWPTVSGWAYWIDTASHTDTSVQCDRPTTREDMEDSALAHLAQNVWTLAVESDDAFVEGLPPKVKEGIRRWILWQRGYARLRAEGKTDAEAHRLASSG